MSAKLKLLQSILKRFNLWDFLLDIIKKTPANELLQVLGKMTNKPNTKTFIKNFMARPDLVAQDLANLTPQQLAELSEAIAKARHQSGYTDADTGAQSQALSSSWLIYGVYTPINDKQGLIKITTIQGKDYSFPKPIKYSTWELMKLAQGRNGSGAGQIFWDEYWRKIKSKQPSPGTATIFKLLEFRNLPKKVAQLTKREIKNKGWKKWQ